MKPQVIANPPNPWSTSEVDYLGEPPLAKLEIYEDHSKEILSENNSPDLGFRYSVNPYRGCMHACAYCYARPYHEYLSLGAGTDFDTKIAIKPKAPALLRKAFDRPSWTGELLAFSGATDCYQPLEASYRLTRGCLEACVDYKNPVCLVTKAPLVERDLDLLVELSRTAALRVSVSIPIWDEQLSRALEPGVATPKRRVQTIRRLADGGVLVGVMVAPLIPGIGEDELSSVLTAARDAGARYASWAMLRLPGSVEQVFEERLRASLPLRAEKVLGRIRQVRGGALNDSRFGLRTRGEGQYAQTLLGLFDATAKRLGLAQELPPLAQTFQRPLGNSRQRSLFEL